MIKNGKLYSDFYRSDGKRIRKPLGLPLDAPQAEIRRAEAALMVAEEAQVSPGAPKAIVGASMTLRDAFKGAKADREEWRTSKSPRTLDATLAAVLLDLGDQVQVVELTKDRLASFRRTLLERNLAPSTVNSRLSLIKVCLEWAAEQGAITGVPVLQRVKVRPGRKRFFTVAEAATLLEHCYKLDRLLGVATELALETGLRRSELTRIAARDVILGSPGIEPRLMVWEAKADNPSPVPLTPKAVELLKPLLDSAKAPEAPLLGLHPDTLTKGFKEAAKLAGMGDDDQACFHALRHTVATRILERSGNIVAAQGFLRHKNIATTQGYAHLVGKQLDAVARVLAGVQPSAQKAVQ